MFLISVVILYNQVFNSNQWPLFIDGIKNLTYGNGLLFFIGAIILMPFNWGIETHKWRLLINVYEPMPFSTSLKAVLSGVYISIFTPNRMGEFAGRIIYLKRFNKIKGTFVTFIGSISQLCVTLVMGALALPIYISITVFPDQFIGKILIITFFAIALLFVFLYFNLGLVPKLVSRIYYLKKYTKWVSILVRYKGQILAKILLFSFLRYIIFSIQFLFLLQAFGFDIYWIKSLIGICTIFFAQAIIPTISLTELGIRGASSVEILGLLSDNSSAILASAWTLWLINLILPAIPGLYFLLTAKVELNHD